MPYILGTVITLGLFILLVDKRRIREFYPTYLFMIVLGPIGDFVLVYGLKLYDYTDPLMPRHWTMLLIATFGYGPLAVLYIQYVQKYNFWVVTAIATGSMTFIEWFFFVRIGALTYYRWNLFASLIAYIALELLIYAQYRWYTGPMRNTARPHEAPED